MSRNSKYKRIVSALKQLIEREERVYVKMVWMDMWRVCLTFHKLNVGKAVVYDTTKIHKPSELQGEAKKEEGSELLNAKSLWPTLSFPIKQSPRGSL